MSDGIRKCPICKGQSVGLRFPFSLKFNGVHFFYHKCGSCKSIFVNPVPDNETFIKMYSKSEYHDRHYINFNQSVYEESAKLLTNFAPKNALVLDYGCGIGSFLKATKNFGFNPFGVEFDEHAARSASMNAGCSAISVDKFFEKGFKTKFDVIHLGDVLEHLPDPAYVLDQLLDYLKPGGLLYVEGPLENNTSLILWASVAFGTIKKWVRPKYIGIGKPTHLFRIDAKQQLNFFSSVESSLIVRHWQIYETGWPYSCGNIIKQIIAFLARLVSGKRILGETFGNRFRGIFICHRSKISSDPLNEK